MNVWKKAVALLLLIVPFTAMAQSEANNTENKKIKTKFNYGIKVGFHAITYNDTEFDIDGYIYNDRIAESNRIGNSVTPFARVTFNRLFLQTEAAFCITRHNFKFSETLPDPEVEPIVPSYELKTHCMQIPFMVGYDFIQVDDTYALSVFTGPKVKLTFTSLSDQEFNHFTYDDLEEQLRPAVLYWHLGLGVKISRFFFDFSYDVGISNCTEGITSASHDKHFRVKRSDNQLSFSVGTIF